MKKYSCYIFLLSRIVQTTEKGKMHLTECTNFLFMRLFNLLTCIFVVLLTSRRLRRREPKNSQEKYKYINILYSVCNLIKNVHEWINWGSVIMYRIKAVRLGYKRKSCETSYKEISYKEISYKEVLSKWHFIMKRMLLKVYNFLMFKIEP